MTQYDPFTGMPIPGSEPPLEQLPTARDAYRMGGLAALAPREGGSILEHTYPVPPEQVWGDYDRAAAKDERREVALQRSPQGRAMALARETFPGAAPQGRLHREAELVKDFVAPSSVSDVAMMALGPLGRVGKFGALALGGGTLDADEAQAGKSKALRGAKNWRMGEVASFERPYAQLGGAVNAGVDAPSDKMIQTVLSPYRMMYPGIYANPREIAATAAERVIGEDPMMKRLWGVTRGDLDEIAKTRVGNEAPQGVTPSARPRGSEAARNIMIPENERRLINILEEGGRYPGLKHADAWYILDPVYQRMEQLFGPEEAIKRFRHFNTMTGMASPGSDVLTELQRGSAAHWLEQQGRFGDFMKFGGVAEGKRGKNFPEDMRYIGGHPYHSTSQALPMEGYLKRGALQSENPKVPLYVHASGVPQTGFQTTAPVGDAHFSRGVGLADTRKGPTDVGASFSRSEYETMAPWWRDKVARQAGLESVPAQARLWTILGPQTGVDSPLGQGKLELFSQQIAKAAKRLNVSPEMARDLILKGGAGAGVMMLAPKMGGVAAQDQYSQ